MPTAPDARPEHSSEMLRTPIGDVPLGEYRLRRGAREWRVLHVSALLTDVEEASFLAELPKPHPYGVALWPSSIVLAHEVAQRGDAFRDASVLELGSGAGLPGIVAASFGARVSQTDREPLALELCRRNGARNRVGGIDYRLADWSAWDDDDAYDWILGSDVLYAEAMHPHLRLIFERNLAPGGRVLLGDPFRPASLRLLESLEADGWTVTVRRWTVGDDPSRRDAGVFELAPPGSPPRETEPSRRT